jgi:hypothetical protein
MRCVYVQIKRVAIESISEFSDYSGPSNDREAGIEYFVDKFLQRNTVHQEVSVTSLCD